MTLVVFEFLTFVVLLAAPAIVAVRRLGVARGFSALTWALVLSGLAGLRSPFMSVAVVKGLLAGLLLLTTIWIVRAPAHWDGVVRRIMGTRGAELVLMLLLCTVVPLGNLEWAARITSDLGWVEAHEPMRTRRMSGIEDWREYHVTSDKLREQDPVTFWRSKRGEFPFNEDGFKALFELEKPKPEGVFRVISYGDSNTEGPPWRDWSRNLHRRLEKRNTPERRYEVVNAGVSGYSSYQGLQRFLQERDVFEPDLIFVSFGWNDIPDALGQPDHAYRAHSKLQVAVLRFLIPYRLFQVIQHQALSEGYAEKMQGAQSRVPLPQYVENMKSFAAESKRANVEVVFLTRPHRATPSALLANPASWRSKVPRYNEALRAFARAGNHHWIDVQKHFEQNHEGMFGDETHFTEEGRQEMARLLEAYLLENGLL